MSQVNKSYVKGSMPPSIGHMELLVWMQRADFSEHIQCFKSPGDPLNSSHFDAPNTKSAPTGYRRAPNIISHYYYGFQTVCKCPFWSLLVTLVTDSNQTWAN